MDFTLQKYIQLLKCLIKANYAFQTFEQFIKNPLSRVIILRHDVDRIPINSLRIARIENQLGICSSFYFRIVKESNNPKIIKQITNLGHEIGYHYEDLTLVKGNVSKGIDSFYKNLEYFQQYYPVKTICMHGSPLSKYDNRDIWRSYNYHKYGIIGEPYFDIDFSEVLYLTDTGRSWDGESVNIRDKPKSKFDGNLQKKYQFKSTLQIINSINKKQLPDKIMINTHPQRWTDNKYFWLKELINQNLKNVLKRLMFN